MMSCACIMLLFNLLLLPVASALDLCLQDFPAKWIYEPWKAPIADQKQANCRIGVDYPEPMVNHADVSKENIQKLKDAYAVNSPTSKTKCPSHASAAASPGGPKRQQGASPVGMLVPCLCSDCFCINCLTAQCHRRLNFLKYLLVADTALLVSLCSFQQKDADFIRLQLSNAQLAHVALQVHSCSPGMLGSWQSVIDIHHCSSVHAGIQKEAHTRTQAKASHQAAAPSASAGKTKAPKSGFDDVVVPDDSADAAKVILDGAGPNKDTGTGVVPGGAGQDDAEPEATLPGGTATEDTPAGSKAEFGKAADHVHDAKQKRLDWSAAAGKKRKADGDSNAGLPPEQPTRTPPKRQCKLKFKAS